MAEKKTTKKPVKKEPKEVKPKLVEKLEITYIYHEGDDISEIAKAITGHEYMALKLLQVNGLSLNTLKEGDVLIWK